MSRISRSTPQGPLARRVDAPADQRLAEGVGAAATLGGRSSRRRALALFGAGAGAAGAGIILRATGAFASAPPADSTVAPVPSSEIPDETPGPFPGDGSNGPDVLEQSGIVRSDMTTSFGDASGVAEGVPVTLELTVYDLANGGAPLEGVAVYAWHCTRDGGYSLYSDGVEDENFLRGVQIADADGRLSFATIFPGCYPGRWPHVHFAVYPDVASIADAADVIVTSQLAFPADACAVAYAEPGYEISLSNLAGVSLETDGIFADDDAGAQIATVTGDVTGGLHASLAVAVDATTAATE